MTCRCGAPLSPSSRVSHCTECHQTFRSHITGDAHRRGPWEQRYCLTPDQMRDRGWRLGANGWVGAPRAESPWT